MDENFLYSTYSIAQELLNFVYMNKRIYLHSYANHTGVIKVVSGVMDRKCILSQISQKKRNLWDTFQMCCGGKELSLQADG